MHTYTLTDTIEPQIKKLNNEISQALTELENEYYTSQYKTLPPTISNNNSTSNNSSRSGDDLRLGKEESSAGGGQKGDNEGMFWLVVCS